MTAAKGTNLRERKQLLVGTTARACYDRPQILIVVSLRTDGELIMRLIHTTRCSKSRGALQLLQDAGYAPEVVLYRDEGVLTDALLQEIEAKTGTPLAELLRTKEEAYAEAKALEGAALRRWVVQNPVLLERPILIVGDRAVVARPPERVWELVEPKGA